MSRIGRTAALVYGTICYAIFFVTFLYLIGFVDEPRRPAVDRLGRGRQRRRGARDRPRAARAVRAPAQRDGAAGLQAGLDAHRAAARSSARPTCSRAAPRSCCCSRPWRPIPTAVWRSRRAPRRVALQAGSTSLGFGIVLYSTFLIDHFDLFGLRQVFLAWRGRAYSEKRFVTPQPVPLHPPPALRGLDDHVLVRRRRSRSGTLLFASAMTAYILVAIRYEERDLAARARRALPALARGARRCSCRACACAAAGPRRRRPSRRDGGARRRTRRSRQDRRRPAAGETLVVAQKSRGV